MRLLVAAGVELMDPAAHDRESLLHLACLGAGHAPMVRLLLKAGCINEENGQKEREKALTLAILFSDPEMVEVLAGHADEDEKAEAFQDACRLGRHEIAMMFIEKKLVDFSSKRLRIWVISTTIKDAP